MSKPLEKIVGKPPCLMAFQPQWLMMRFKPFTTRLPCVLYAWRSLMVRWPVFLILDPTFWLWNHHGSPSLIIIVTPKKIEKVKFPTIFAGFYCSIFLGRLLTRPFIGPSSLFQRGPNLGNQGICGLLAVSQKHLLPAKRRVFFWGGGKTIKNMGLSENSVPLHPMVNDHYPY